MNPHHQYHQSYFQIYENNHPLVGKTYADIKKARKELIRIQEVSTTQGKELGYLVEKRLPYLPIRTVLGLRKTYADGTNVYVTYLIKTVKFTNNINF